MIDCLLIGYNEMELEEYASAVKQFGLSSGAFRDLRLNYIKFNEKLYDFCEIFNSCTEELEYIEPLTFSESFSATISYLGSYLDKHHISFGFIQNFRFEKEKLRNLLVNNEVLTIGISTTYFVSLYPIVEMIEFIRQYNQSAKIILGGPFVAAQVRTLDDFGLDFMFEHIGADVYVHSSQGESALVKVIQALKRTEELGEIANIYYKTDDCYRYTFYEEENNKIVENPVNWELFKNDIYKCLNLRTSISCPFNCSFCGSPKYQGAYQVVSVEQIEQELNKLNEIQDLTSVHFIEDTLNFPPKRFKELLRTIIKNKYKFRWHSYYRCQFADNETVELMKESGCEAVYLGLESGSNQILKNMNKSVTVEKYIKGIDILKEYNILTHGNFIIGFPGETEESVYETKKFIQNCGIDFFRMQLWYCMPITPIWERRDEFKIMGNGFEWQHATMNSAKACELLEEIFLSVDDPVWLPQLNFDINGLIHLMHRGVSLNNLKTYIKCFIQNIRKNIIENSEQNITVEDYNNMKSILFEDLVKINSKVC